MNKPYIFGIGLPKTGTSSLTAALNTLGIPTVHNAYHGKKISHILRENRSHDLPWLHPLYLEYRGFTDFRGEYTYQELYTQYPDSLFIYTHRSLPEWFESRANSYRKDIQITDELYADDIARVHINMVYEHGERTEAIRKFFRDKPQQYLELDICAGEGWEKLCGFLKVAVPAEPFPHTNITTDKLQTTPQKRNVMPPWMLHPKYLSQHVDKLKEKELAARKKLLLNKIKQKQQQPRPK
jgi:hypothetical protein